MVTPGPRIGSRVLFVGDDVSVGDACARSLRLEGYEVWGALSGREGLALAQRHLPDAIIIDLRRPLASSLDLVGSIRGIQGLEHTPVAVVANTPLADAELRDRAAALGVSLHFRPVWLRELVELARQLAHLSLVR